MTEEWGSQTPPQDSGLPDQVERDGAALSSAEDLDEDRMRVDPLEAGMDPPEHWTAADSYGVTPFEQAHPRPLDDRLAQEKPDVEPERPAAPDADVTRALDDEPLDETIAADEGGGDPQADLDAEVLAEAAGRGQVADEAGGSVASEMRTPIDPASEDLSEEP